MKNILYATIAMAMVLLSSCSKDSELVPDYGGYGYVQVNLMKAGTRTMTEGNTLDYLADARKVKLSLRQGDKTIEQTLGLSAAGAEGAEYALASENLKLMAGQYSILSYAIYGDYKSGDMAEVLQVCKPDAPITLTIREGELTRQRLDVQARQYGRFSGRLIRIEPEVATRAEAVYSGLYDFDDIDSVQIVMQRMAGGVAYSEDRKVKAVRNASDRPVFDTEDMQLEVGDYTITHFELFNKRGLFMYAQDTEIPFTVKQYERAVADMDVQQQLTEGIYDGIALKQIWEAMDGKSWNWHEADGNGGANWIFSMADGSPRPVSAWINQVGVVVINGRVVSLNLGSFNPKGDVPDAIGQLTALEKLYLGMHTDEVYYHLEGTGGIAYRLNPWTLGQHLTAADKARSRMDIARERTAIRRLNQEDFSLRASRILYKGKTDPEAMLAAMHYAAKAPALSDGYRGEATPYGQFTSDPANRITGISPEIGRLTNLQELYIANTLITRLPIELQNLTGLTDLELFNNPFEDVDGEIFKNMTELVAVNFDSFYRMSQPQIQAMLDKMCDYCPRIQLLYMNRMGLEKLPDHISRLTDLRLLDVNFNKIASVKSIKPIAPIQLMMSYNLLTRLPDDFINVGDLELCCISDNKLEEFPAVLSNRDGNYTIEEIDLTGNRIHGFQAGFKGLKVEKLKLGYNCLGHHSAICRSEHGTEPADTRHGEFPVELSQNASEVNYLVLSGNNIDTIRNAGVASIKYLQALDISVNNLTALPTYLNGEHFPYLTGVDASHNRFNRFPETVLNVPSLSQLYLADQGYYRDAAETQWIRTMTNWPDYLHQHGALTNLDVKGNDIRNVINFPTNLTTLDVRNNPNIRMRVPQWIINKMDQGLFVLYYDEGQDIKAE